MADGIQSTNYWDEYRKKLIQNSVIAEFTREKESLNGEWNYGIDQYDTCLRNRWYNEHETDGSGRNLPLDYSFDEWDTIQVPSCWNFKSEKLFLYEGSIVYTRKFIYENKGEKRVFIKFSAVNYKAAVFINQTYMGMHEGGSTPFYIEVTDILKVENRILIVVNNSRYMLNVPMDNTDWFNYGGIYRDVELIRLPEAFIKNYSISYKNQAIFVNVKTVGGNNEPVTFKIPELGINTSFIGSINLVNVKPELWFPENPKLYEVEIAYCGDKLKDKVGFREIKVEGRNILINGKSIYLKGVCAHEESIKNGKAVTDEEVREMYALAKEMNCNFMRLAHYPHAENAARIADEMGMLLWEEIPVYWAIAFDNSDTYKNAENQLTELITRDINRASVIIWSIGNENVDTDLRLNFMKNLAEKARELDNSRLVSAACFADGNELKIIDRLAEYLDIIGINEYYGWYDPEFTKLPKILENSNPDKPVVITEFGADCRAGLKQTGTRDDMFSEEFQLDVYEKQIEMLSGIDYIKGTCPWIFFDFRCPRRLHYVQDYYNLKGLLTADRKYKKKAFYAMQKFYK